ncbi:cytidylate kinase family protein [Sphaerisporangium sp. NBC_01403]|uniref:cytidylate kinase family protein n=1 Tax=Sphaerisporangium sp. NBC_01403 TaxID=2903599 RepID=UPI0032509B7C
MMQHGTRDDLLGRLTAEIGSATTTHPLRVAIDGPPAAGKTTLADELAVVLRAQGREVIRATIDDFLFPRAQRYRRGQYSPESCYFDAHDRDAIRRVLLDPLGPDGDRRFQTAVYHRETDTTLSLPITTAPADAVLLFDGVFLLRPELLDRWDLSIFMAVTFDRTLDRAQARGTALAGPTADTTEIERSWRYRYIPSQQLYFAQARPTDHADIIVNNDELQRPAWEVRPHRSVHKI